MRIIFFGTPDFAVPTLKALLGAPGVEVAAVVTQPDRSAGRGQKVRISPVKALAQSHAIPILQPERIRGDISGFIRAVSAHGEFSLGVVVAFGQILPSEVLALPARGCVNIHASLLPRWRGAAPIQRAIMAGDTETGVCLMQMNEGLDSGPVYAVRALSIPGNATFGELHDSLAGIGAELLSQNIEKIVHGELVPEPQDATKATLAPKVEASDQTIDWARSASELALQIRALSPNPGAMTYWNGRRLKIARAVPKAGPPRNAPPGSVSRVDNEQLEVSCGSGVLSLEEVQLEGKRRMTAADFLRGSRIPAGALFGEQHG